MPTPIKRRVRVIAPDWSAGLMIDADDRCAVAPPVMQWTLGKPADEVLGYCRRKGWTIEEQTDPGKDGK